MTKGNPFGGFQPRNTQPERRAFFDVRSAIQRAVQDLGGLNIIGRVPTEADLPGSGNPGDAYITDDPADHLWVWTEGPPPGWVDTGPFNITDHEGLSGVTPNQHHNQAHSFHGADHPDVSSGVIPLIRHVHAFSGPSAQWAPEYRLNWRGSWSPGIVYEVHDVVTDDSWLMAANKQTQERAAPQAVGDPFNIYTGVNPTRQDVAKSITFGNRYTFGQTGYITGWRIWTVAGNVYTVYSIQDPDGDRVLTELASITGSGGWQEFSISNVLVGAGTEFELAAVVQEPDETPTFFAANYDYDTPNNPSAPLSGQIIHANTATSTLSIHKTDNDGLTPDLASVEIGDIIRGPNIQWAVQNIIDQGTYIDFAVAPATQDSPDGVHSFVFEVVTATPITVLEDPAYWPSSPYPATQGMFAVEGDPIAYNTNAYGTDVTVQVASISDDWDTLSAPGGGGSSSGGGGGVDPNLYTPTDLTITDPMNEYMFDVDIIDDASDNSAWVDRLRISLSGRIVSWFNEFGEIRGIPSSASRVFFRIFAALNESEWNGRNPDNPVMQVSNYRNGTGSRASVWEVNHQGDQWTAGEVYTPSIPIVRHYDNGWPDAGVPAGTPVTWVQDVVGGPVPPSGGRPGREPGDLVFLAQEQPT